MVGPISVLAAFLFFVLGSYLQSALINPVATLVSKQERLEGTLRQSHGERPLSHDSITSSCCDWTRRFVR